MEELLEVYREIRAGQPNLNSYSWDNITINFSNNVINLFNYTGDMPCGRYKLPLTEQEFINRVTELNEKVGDLENHNQFLCGKCGGTFDLPEHTRDRFGAFICESCANGGDIRKPAKESEKKSTDKSTESKVEKAGQVTTPTISSQRLTADEAIKFLREQGYVIKKSVKSFKVVAQDAEGSIGVTDEYYRSKEDFEAQRPKLKFISIVKELSTSDEEPLD